MGRPNELTEEQRQDLLAKGWRALEVWVIDRESEAYKAEVARQLAAAADADSRDPDIDDWTLHVRGDLWDDEAP
ncbi:antitoxin MazE-like protein [Mangrovibrevibacter kandeliae]|uniref:antitoxin MazE-like protein n=1 Tax=Mangrovibrevibacter kandeliae TaxID=2968473 RepID=UPI0021196332|nr:antitoxin MazE-like protein [Aurantimonas sp. CSK15Z-1]MCQ8780891.1 DUF3018 family protein [Aurantimonas sp. CSK15Z-1]